MKLSTLPVKCANTGTFEDLAHEADKRKRNRRVTQALLDALDPQGVHIVVFAMIHNDMEMRTQWFVKLSGHDEPAVVMLDLSFDDYDKLPTVAYDHEGKLIVAWGSAG